MDKEERERTPLAVLGIRKMWEALAMHVLQVNDHKKASSGNDRFHSCSTHFSLLFLVAANAAAVFDLCWQLRVWKLLWVLSCGRTDNAGQASRGAGGEGE
jgi:hypothetical protein